MTGETDTTPAATPDTAPSTDTAPLGMNLAPDSLPAADPGILAAVKASIAGEPAPDPAAPPATEATPAAPTTPAAAPTPTDPAAAAPPAEPAAPAARPSDEFGALPADAKAETKERFEKLRTSYDQKVEALTAAETAAREAREQVDGWREAVVSTGTSPEQFGQTLAFLKDLNSGTQEGIERAWSALTGQLAEMAKALGREVPGVFDPLAAHADLQARLNDPMDPLTREDAAAIAHARNRAAALEQGQREFATRAAQQGAEQQAIAARNGALAEIQSFGAQTRATDPLFDAKMRAIAPAIDLVARTLPPAQWAAEVRRLYAGVQIAAPAPAPAGPRVPNPIRPTSAPVGAGGVIKQPGSMLEAARMALGK